MTFIERLYAAPYVSQQLGRSGDFFLPSFRTIYVCLYPRHTSSNPTSIPSLFLFLICCHIEKYVMQLKKWMRGNRRLTREQKAKEELKWREVCEGD